MGSRDAGVDFDVEGDCGVVQSEALSLPHPLDTLSRAT
jgi:hypothetical protein